MNPILEFRPATAQERLYTYSQSHELVMKTGFIGYLRGDFGKGGISFYTTWFNIMPDRNTIPFKNDFDRIVNALREDRSYHGILAGRRQMLAYCRTQPESAMTGAYTTEYAFRIDTGDYACLMRLNPTVGDYNFYISCYEKKWLDRHLRAASVGIRFITPNYDEKFRIPDGDQIRMIRPEGDHLDRTVRFIDEYHIEVGFGTTRSLYHICEFAERMEQNQYRVIPLRSSLPEQCYTTLQATGEIVTVKRGEPGYEPSGLPDDGPAANRATVDRLNSENGVSKAQEQAMFAGSLFGWDTRAADPKNYTEDGILIKPPARSRGEAR